MDKIEVKFCLTTSDDTVDLNYISEKLQITPTRIRRKADFLVKSIGLEIPINEWLYAVESECDVVSKVVYIIQNIFEKKKDILNELCNHYCLKVKVNIIIHMEDECLPEIVLTQDNLKFFSDINAEIALQVFTN